MGGGLLPKNHPPPALKQHAMRISCRDKDFQCASQLCRRRWTPATHKEPFLKNLNQLRKRERETTHAATNTHSFVLSVVCSEMTGRAQRTLTTLCLDSQNRREVKRGARAASTPCLLLVALPSLTQLASWLAVIPSRCYLLTPGFLIMNV